MRPSCLTTILVVESLLAINTVAAAVAANTLGRLQVLSRGSPCLLTRHALTTSACTLARLRAANDVHHAVYIVVRLSSLSHFITPPPIGERSIAMTVSVCVSVSLCVCSVREHISGKTRPIFTNFFSACRLLTWLGPPLSALRYDTYSGFMHDVILAHKPKQLNVAAQMMEAQATSSLGLGYKRRVGILIAGQRTHTNGPTFRAPRSGPTRSQWAC